MFIENEAVIKAYLTADEIYALDTLTEGNFVEYLASYRLKRRKEVT